MKRLYSKKSEYKKQIQYFLCTRGEEKNKLWTDPLFFEIHPNRISIDNNAACVSWKKKETD